MTTQPEQSKTCGECMGRQSDGTCWCPFARYEQYVGVDEASCYWFIPSSRKVNDTKLDQDKG